MEISSVSVLISSVSALSAVGVVAHVGLTQLDSIIRSRHVRSRIGISAAPRPVYDLGTLTSLPIPARVYARIVGKWSGLLSSAGFDRDARQMLVTAAFWVGGGSLAAALVTGSPVSLLVVPAISVAGARMFLARRVEQRESLLRSQLPTALGLLSSALSSGLSLSQAFAYAADETPSPLDAHLRAVVSDVGAGMSFTQSIQRMRREVNVREIEFLVTAIELQYRTGGNLCELLESSAVAIRGSLELKRTLRVQTSQARFSAQMVGLLPLGLMGLLCLISPDYSRGLFGSPLGTALLVVALAMEAAGYALVTRVARIEV